MTPLRGRGLRGSARRFLPANLRQSYALARSPHALIVDWVNRGPVKQNWGDAVAPHLVHSLSGRPVVNRRDILATMGHPVYTTIGSMLGSIQDDGFQVWGTGFITGDTVLKARPGAVHMVRGPLTWKSLRDQGCSAPERFGDPAQLACLLFPRKSSSRYELGVIPHFKERDLPVVETLRQRGAKIIDICGGIDDVCDQVAQCDHVISSSLHGLVLADSYGKQAAWVAFSNRPAGDGFKFKDYLSSTPGRLLHPVDVERMQTTQEVVESIPDIQPEMHFKEMLESCPFVSPSRLNVLTEGL